MGDEPIPVKPTSPEQAVFAEALQCDTPEARMAYLDAACGTDSALRRRVEVLLRAAENAGDFLEEPPTGLSEDADATQLVTELISEKPGDRIGRYKLLEQIGEGGCGTVYLAEQEEPVRRRVALKVIKLGMDTKQVIARFEAERQALALMDHPNIAKVLDGGATPTGRPYFVMELVRGVRITQFCDQARLPTEARLRLFVLVCQAIQHAHQKGIIHRDLKPSNILVTVNDGMPVPKVIDFGIAKATGQRLTDKSLLTQFHSFIGTPAYTSPEQAEMSSVDIDTRSDIYSLGVLLYELLIGRTPFDGEELLRSGLDEMRRILRETEPVRPSTRLSTLTADELTTSARRRHTESPKLIHLVRGDLDWIVMKALEKDRTRRYETASGLAGDVQRHLDDEPVQARPPRLAYKAGKFVRKHRGAVVGASAVLVVLLAGLAASTILYLRERAAWASEAAQRNTAERHAVAETAARKEAETISTFFKELFWSPDPEEDGRAGDFNESLARAGQKLEADLARLGAQRITVQEVLSATYSAYGLYREAAPLLEEVRNHYLANFGPEHPDTLRVMTHLASEYSRTGRRDEAFQLNEELLALYGKVLGPEDVQTIYAKSRLANSYAFAGRREEALKLREEGLALKRTKFGAEHPDTLLEMQRLAQSYEDCGRSDEALRLLVELSPRVRKDTNLGRRVTAQMKKLQKAKTKSESANSIKKTPAPPAANP
jgi:tetratricopeptide (TPR) repeat protein